MSLLATWWLWPLEVDFGRQIQNHKTWTCLNKPEWLKSFYFDALLKWILYKFGLIRQFQWIRRLGSGTNLIGRFCDFEFAAKNQPPGARGTKWPIETLLVRDCSSWFSISIFLGKIEKFIFSFYRCPGQRPRWQVKRRAREGSLMNIKCCCSRCGYIKQHLSLRNTTLYEVYLKTC